MSISKVQAIVVGTLSDQRMQAWATTASGLPQNTDSETYSRWKITTDPDSGWTDWQQQPADYNNIQLLGMVLGQTGQSQLFALVGDYSALDWRLKATSDPGSGWMPWMSFSPPWPPPDDGEFTPTLGIFAAGVLGGQEGPYFANTPIQLWLAISDGPGLFTLVSIPAGLITDDPDTFYGLNQTWSGFQPQTPDMLAGIWPLNGGSGGGQLNTVPVWAVGDEGILYWISATIFYGDEGNLAAGPNWGEWQPFIQLPDGATVTSFAAGLLTDGRIQLFASCANGTLYSIWQDDIETGAWLPGWTAFPQPGGRPVLVNDTDNVLFPSISTQPLSLAIASLPDQRLQLFAIDDTASTWSTWKSTTDPDAGWVPWSEF
jgi:hypothetical protein